MTPLRLEVPRKELQPGDAIAGTAEWMLDDPPERIELRLYWQTSGKGAQDLEVVEAVPFEHAGARDRREFRIEAPATPYSFSGKLISLAWGLELVALPSGEAIRIDLTLSPTGRELRLHAS